MSWAEHPVFMERVGFLEHSQGWSPVEHARYQLASLRRLARHVHARVPFYRDAMAKGGFGPDDIRTLDDLKRFPFIDKKIIQTDPEAFLADTAEKARLIHRTTGGSTGTPLTIWYDEDFLARDKANTEHYMRVFGLDIFTWRSARLYGDKIDHALVEKGEYWRVEDDRKLVLSCYHVNAGTAPAYVAQLNDFAPRYIHTRPSSILPLARAILHDGLAVNPIRTIICDGEYLTDGQRSMIERAFRARLVNIFGHTEACTVGHPCPHSDALHAMPQVGILELLDETGREVATPGGRGEMVTTGFNNLVMPLIRYRTGDIAYLGEQSCRCGRHYKMLSGIEGRLQDYVIDHHGDPQPLAPAVFNYNDMDWKGIREFKVIQKIAGLLTVQVVPEPGAALDHRLVEARLSAILDDFTVTVELVADIPKTRIGKHRYLEQYLDVAAKVSF